MLLTSVELTVLSESFMHLKETLQDLQESCYDAEFMLALNNMHNKVEEEMERRTTSSK
jgi:hypothetical protein